MPKLIDRELWIEPTITVLDDEDIITFHLQDCLNFHGYDAVGGVALGWRLLQTVQALLNAGEPMQRRDVSLFTAFPGLGARDVFELVTRMCSEDRFELNLEFVHPEAQAGVAGAFYYRFSYQGKTVELAPVEGAPSADFIATGKASKDPQVSEALLRHWTSLKHDLANTLLQNRASEVIRRL